MTQYNFTIDASIEDWDIKIDPAALYGYFEWVGGTNMDEECTGGLWFDRLVGGALALTDYDGVATLPNEVRHGLTQKDIVVSEEFY